MSKRTALEIGLKLLGVYAAILGGASLASNLAVLFVSLSTSPAAQLGGVLLTSALTFVSPIVYLSLAYALTRKTPDCVRWCLGNETGDA